MDEIEVTDKSHWHRLITKHWPSVKITYEDGSGITYGDIGDATAHIGSDMQADVVGTWSKSDNRGWMFLSHKTEATDVDRMIERVMGGEDPRQIWEIKPVTGPVPEPWHSIMIKHKWYPATTARWRKYADTYVYWHDKHRNDSIEIAPEGNVFGQSVGNPLVPRETKWGHHSDEEPFAGYGLDSDSLNAYLRDLR